MYVYYYEAKNGKINISCAKVIDMTIYTRGKCDYYWVRVDGRLSKYSGDNDQRIHRKFTGEKVPVSETMTSVSTEEGHIYQDKFWLNEKDDERALEIIKNRFRERINEAKKQIEKLEEYLK